MRAPGQMALYLVVDQPGEHIRFRYLHMNPAMLDAGGLFSGRQVREGEVIGKVGNYFQKPGGTSYHLHFDVQVPTREGWVFVNPYMTLVAAYERLIGGRGEMVNDMMLAGAPVVAAGASRERQASTSPPQNEQHTEQEAASEGDDEPSAAADTAPLKTAAPVRPAVSAVVRANVKAKDHSRRADKDSRQQHRHSQKDKRDRKKLSHDKDCKTRVVKGHRRRICNSDDGETREGTVRTRTVRSVDRHVSHKSERPRHHREHIHKGHERAKARHGGS
jgi:hypothetical protein